MSLVLYGSFLSSCSTLNSKKSKEIKSEAWLNLGEEHFKNQIKLLCLSGEGRGHIVLGKDSQSFNFESLFDPKGKWSMSAYIPLYGEEVIHIDWEKIIQGRIEVSGGFYQRLLEQLENMKGNLNIKSNWRPHHFLQTFFLDLGFFFYFISTVEMDSFKCKSYEQLRNKKHKRAEINGQCSLNKPSPLSKKTAFSSFEWISEQNQFVLVFPSTPDQMTLTIEADQFKNNYFKRINISLGYSNESTKTRRKTINLTLSFSQCI